MKGVNLKPCRYQLQPRDDGRLQYPIQGDSNFFYGRGKKHYWKKLVQIYREDPENPVIIPSQQESTRSMEVMNVECKLTKGRFPVVNYPGTPKRNKILQHQHPVNMQINPEIIKVQVTEPKPVLETIGVQCQPQIQFFQKVKSQTNISNPEKDLRKPTLKQLQVLNDSKIVILPRISQNRHANSQGKNKYRIQTQPTQRQFERRSHRASPSFVSSLQNPLVDAFAYIHQYCNKI